MVRRSPARVLAAVFATLISVAAGAQTAPHSITPLDIRILSPAGVVPTTDGAHLVFEAVIGNYAALPMTLATVHLGTASSPDAFGRFEGAALDGLLQRPGRASGDGVAATLQGNSFAVALFDVRLADTAVTPQALAGLRLGVTIAPFKPGLPDTTLNTGVAVPVNTWEPTVLSAPLRGGGWVAFNALSNTSIHRTTLMVVDGQVRVPERYAIDFVQLDGQGREFAGEQGRNESWPGYGQPVLAVADGVVTVVRDGLPDNVPGQPPAQKATLDTIAGNMVILRAGAVSVMCAHLIPGSLTVRPGQAVRKGQVLGRLGNSGQSDAPHLHLQVTDLDHPAAADGLPFVFDAFTLEGTVADTAAIDAGGAWTADAPPQARRHQLPLENAVLGF
ncbi:MAG: M23 family metallopeptidase [Azospirillaceae bacterium]|nr:M23 family metallopeptidase [Azospirillaceae bacterium]